MFTESIYLFYKNEMLERFFVHLGPYFFLNFIIFLSKPVDDI